LASFAGQESPGTLVTLDAGEYSVDEDSVFGYAKTLGTDCKGSIGIGETKTCTITNDDISPQLTVIKHVINDDGNDAVAADFVMIVTGTNVSTPSFPGNEAPGTTVTLNAGNYSVDEQSDQGYIKSLSADCAGILGVGETKTCTITNDDKPSPTRTQGYWQTHTVFATATFGQIAQPLTIGTHQIDSSSKLFSGFYSSISKTSTGKKRTPLDQARMQLLQQWLAAKLNCTAFTCSNTTKLMLDNAATAFGGSDVALIKSFASQIDSYNNSNDALPIASQGKATPKDSQSQANTAAAFWDVLP
jgi:hypothetical protein